MKIALDYDDTFTKDPLFWETFIGMTLMRGHEVMIVTFRDPELKIDHDLGIPVFYTSYKAKRDYMRWVQGIKIDIWIDDSPDTIVANSTWTDADRERWRQEHYEG